MILLIASFAALVAPAHEAGTCAPRAGGDPPWPTYHGDDARTGNSTDSGPLTNHMLWSNSTGLYSYSSPAIAGGKVYLPADDGSIYCFWASNGTRIWRTVLSAPAWAGPAVDVANDRVYVCDGTAWAGSTTHYAYGLNASSGAQIWRKPLTSFGESSPLIYNDTIIVGTGDYYMGTMSNNLYCFNSTNGNQVWATPSAGSCASPAFLDGRLYSVGNGLLRCMDPVTGAIFWNATVSAGYGSPSAADGIVYYPGAGGHVYAFLASNGSKVWETNSGYPESYSTCAISNGSVYACVVNSNQRAGALVSMDALVGGVKWTYPVGGESWGAPAVSGNQAYLCYGTTVICINISTQSMVWSYTGPAGTSQYGIGSSPSIASGKLYVGAAESKIYCFGPGVPNTPPAALKLEQPAEIRETSLVLGWNRSDAADFARYEVHRSLTPSFVPGQLTLHQPGGNITDVNRLSLNLTGLSYSTHYFFKLRLWDNGEPPMFNDSFEVEATTATPNGAPAAVALFAPQDVSPFSMRLSWSANADQDFARYELHRGLSKGFTLGGATLLETIDQRDHNSTLVESLKPWTVYYFRVRVYDNGSPPLRNDSNELEARTGNTPPSAAVLNPVQMGATSAALSWSASPDEDFARYEVHFSRNATFSPEKGTLAANLTGRQLTDFTLENLELARTYYFLVRTTDVGGLWNDSNIVSGMTMNTVPRPVISSPGDGDIYDTRTPVTFNCSGSTDQDRDPLSFFWTSSVSGFLSKQEEFTTLLAEGEHRITLYVNDGAGHNVSAKISLTVNKAPDRAPVMAVAFPVDNGELAGIVTLHGTASDPDGNGSITVVELSIDKAAWLDADGLTSWYREWNTSKVANGKHKIAFRAFDGELYSPEVTVSFRVLNIIINLRPTVAITGPSVDKPLFGTVTVTGTASDPEGNLSRVEMSLNGGGWSMVTGASTWSYVLDTTAMRNGMHSIQVRSFDGVNYSDAAQLDFKVSNAGAVASPGPSNILLIGVAVVVIAAVLAAVLVMRRRRPKATAAQPPAAPPGGQPAMAQQFQPPQQQPAAEQYQPQQQPVAEQYLPPQQQPVAEQYLPPQQQAAAEQYQPQAGAQPPAPGYRQPPPEYPLEYRPIDQSHPPQDQRPPRQQ
jgi:outer membrane protein assembly factor BamB